MKIVIPGGAGFIGTALSRHFANKGYEVVVLSRLPEQAPAVLREHAEVVAWDGITAGPWVRQLRSAGAVINLSGENVGSGLWTHRKKQRIRDSRIFSTRTLVDALRAIETRPAVLLNASAIGYYGPHGDEKLRENWPPGNDFMAELCRDWEYEANKATELGVRVVTMRIGVVLGRGGGALAKMALPFRFFGGGRLGSGKQWMSWIHLDDLVGLFEFALEKATVLGPMNATAPEPVTNAEFTRTLARVLHRPALATMPAFALKALLREQAQLILNSQRVIPDKAQEMGYRFKFPLLQAALESLLT